MRLRDVVAGAQYATCDGRLVVPKDPVVKEYSQPYFGGEIVRHTAVDPWGGCTSAKKPEQLGILVTQYNVDRDGVAVDGSGLDAVVLLKDVKGTWAQFLVLHGEKVRAKADAAEWDRRVAAIDKDLGIKLGRILPNIGVGTRQPWKSKGHDISSVSVHFSIETIGEWQAFATMLDEQFGIRFDAAAQLEELLPLVKEK